MKSSSIDRTNNTEVQEFNRLLEEYQTAMFGKQKPMASPKSLINTFKDVQKTYIDKDLLNKLKIDNTVIDADIASMDIKSFYNKISGE